MNTVTHASKSVSISRNAVAHRSFFRLSACAVGVACVSAILAAAPAGAAPVSAELTDSRTVFTRTISNDAPGVGETLSYTQKFTTTSGNDYIYEWKNNIDSCLDYIPGSAKLSVNGAAPVPLPEDKVSAKPGVTHIKTTESAGYWTFNASAPHEFTLDYRVSDRCKPDQKLESGFWYTYGTSFFGGSKTYAPAKFNGGPAATVRDSSKTATTTTLVDAPSQAFVDQVVALKATVAAADNQAALAGKEVSFTNGGQTLCTASLDAAGNATCDWTPTASGPVSLRAQFAGADTFAGSTSEAVQLTVTVAPPKAPTELSIAPQRVSSTEWTSIKGKAEPNTIVEALGPGGTRCVAKPAEDGNFTCTLGFLPAGKGQTISVTAIRENVKSPAETLTVDVADSSGAGGSFGLPSPSFGAPSPGLPSPGVGLAGRTS